MKLIHGVHEVRLFRPNGVAVGYFDNLVDALRAVENEPQYKACYLTLNPIRLPASIPVNPQSLVLSKNSAGDTDIERRVRLLVDLDAPRPPGTNSTEAEKQSARDQAEGVRAYLKTRGWPAPMFADSGNGWHINYRIDLPTDANATAIVKSVLEHLKQLFPMVDAGNTNASRVCKLYGTWARKGEHSDLRPHRKSAVVEEGSDVIVPEELLRAIAPVPATNPEVTQDKSSRVGLQELQRFLEFFGVPTRSDPRQVRGGWQIEIECPWQEEHSSEAPRDTVVSFVKGFGFKCFHSHCVARHWHEFRAELERRNPGRIFSFAQTEDVGEVEIRVSQPAAVPECAKPTYPIEVWDETAVGEFAKLCGQDNNVPRKMYAEAFRCVLGAVVGDRLSCSTVESLVPRSFTVIVAPKGKGKGTAIRRAVRFFAQPFHGTRKTSGLVVEGTTPGLLSGERDFDWKPKGIGAWMAAASSVPGMARLTKDLDSTLKNKPHMTWGGTLPRIISVHEEMKTFLSTLFIEGGVGSGMEGVVCQLWDDVSFHGTATGTRDAVYGEMMFSLLAGVTEQDWFDLLSRGNAVGGA